MDSLGRRFAAALGAKDFERTRKLLAPGVDFRALTPRRAWEPADADAVVTEVLPIWFDDSDHIDEVVEIREGEPVVERAHVSWRFRGHNDDGPFLVEQQAYYVIEGDRITWMRVLCAGVRPDPRG